MFERALLVLTFVAAVGSGLVAGIFFAFSNFVVPALDRLPPDQGIATMNSINITVYNPGFMLAFLGTGALCLALAGGSYLWWATLEGKLLLAAALLYIIGSIGVTMVGNVPLNGALAAVQPDASGAADLWQRFLRDWTLWNHVRTVSSLASAIVFLMALIQRMRA